MRIFFTDKFCFNGEYQLKMKIRVMAVKQMMAVKKKKRVFLLQKLLWKPFLDPEFFCFPFI